MEPPRAREAPVTAWLKRHAVKLALAIVVVVLALFYLGPYITLLRLKAAVEERNAEEVAECVDFPAVRQSLKVELETAVSQRFDTEKNPLAALAAGLAVSVADGFVDRLITPEGLATLMAGQKPALAGNVPTPGTPAREPLEGATYGYESFGTFVVKVPTQGGSIRFVLVRNGIDWKLSRIEIPTGN
jgi:hypothetical protein